MIAVLGVDGSGKSTLLAGLERRVAGSFAGVDRWHLLSRQRPGRERPPVTDPHGRPPRSLPASLAKIVLYLVKAWALRSPRVAAARRRGRLVVIDRDLPDASLDPRRYRLAAPEPLLRLLERCAPRPDLVLVLDADASTIAARSAEVEPDVLEVLLGRYRAYARGRPFALLLDARRPPDELVDDAAAHVLAAAGGRART